MTTAADDAYLRKEYQMSAMCLGHGQLSLLVSIPLSGRAVTVTLCSCTYMDYGLPCVHLLASPKDRPAACYSLGRAGLFSTWDEVTGDDCGWLGIFFFFFCECGIWGKLVVGVWPRRVSVLFVKCVEENIWLRYILVPNDIVKIFIYLFIYRQTFLQVVWRTKRIL